MTMACCGNKRISAGITTGTHRGERMTGAAVKPSNIPFEYTGAQTLRVRGPVTGRDYWFGHNGARVLVDSRDAPSFGGVPNVVRRV